MARLLEGGISPEELAVAEQLIHVVRHAHAGDPSAWRSDDDLRPLSDKGCDQAERLTRQIGGKVAAVYSSPSLRCLGTVLPLARAQRLDVVTRAQLYEGGGGAALLDMLLREPRFPVVACTHGDVLVDLLGILRNRGLVPVSAVAEKASTWTLGVSAGKVSSARYAPPP